MNQFSVCFENMKITVGQKLYIPASENHDEKGLRRAAAVARRVTKHRLRNNRVISQIKCNQQSIWSKGIKKSTSFISDQTIHLYHKLHK